MNFNEMSRPDIDESGNLKDYQLIEPKKSGIPKKWRAIFSIAVVIAIFLVLYLWSIRPIYHTEFINLTRHNIQGNTALLIFDSQRLRQGEFIVGGAGDSRHLLVNIETGRQLRLSYVPFHGLAAVSLISEERVIVRNRRGEVAIINPYTRQIIIPFGNYRRFWNTHNAYPLATVLFSPEPAVNGRYERTYTGIVNITTGEELLAPNRFRSVELLWNSDRYAMVAVTDYFAGGEFRYGVYCLYTHTLLTDTIYSHRSIYRNGLIALWGQGDSEAVVSLPDGEVLILPGQFAGITLVSHNTAAVRQNWGGETALIDVRTGEVLIEYGIYDSFGDISASPYGNAVLVRLGSESGIYYLDTHEVVWQNEVSAEEWTERIGLNASDNTWLDRNHETWVELRRQYEQVVGIGRGRFLVRNGNLSYFVLPN